MRYLVNLIRRNLIFLLSATLLLVVWGEVRASQTGIGFQASLHTRPHFVSLFEAHPTGFSVARPPKLRADLSARPKPGPKIIRFSRERSSLTFNTEYYSYLRDKRSLVPVTVDAVQYNQYRQQIATDQQFRKELNKSISDPDKSKVQRGLGLSVGLPKRLGRMFGEGGAGLVVSGSRRISFSGRSQWTDGASNDAQQQSKFPALNMEQISQFTIAGTIGTKISVKVSQNSKQDIPLANRIQIRYKGDDDDILKSIEAGNTTLDLPSTRFSGYSSRINGLFGIKAAAEVGALRLTAIASQEKGTSERASYSPTGSKGGSFYRDYEYAADRIFDLGRAVDLQPGDRVINLYVYEQSSAQNDLEADFAIMVVDPDSLDGYPGERVDGIRAQQMEPDGTKYEYRNDPDKIPYVVFSSAGYQGRAIGVWMQVVKKGQTDTTTIGNIEADTLVLRLLRPAVPSPSDETWQLMWRNCYSVGRKTTLNDLDIRVLKGEAGAETGNSVLETQRDDNGNDQAYIEILGLDRENTTGANVPDGRVDDILELYEPAWGLLIFPEREPFNTDVVFTDASGNKTQELEEKTPNIYNKTYKDQARINGSKYFLSVASTTTQGSSIKLNRPNIIEGSERVLVNGELMTKGLDYTIDYNFGTITMASSRAQNPNADVEIDYEYAPFLALQKKTLLGMRAEYDWSESFKLGSTILYKSDKAQDRKPKVGQETSKMLVYDVDATLKLDLGFLTNMVDALPLIESDRPSMLTMSGEVAQSHPDPNIEGTAWVDDFESALDQRSLGSSRLNWHLGSEPLAIQDQGYVRGKILWHRPRDVVRVDDVYDRESAQGESTMPTFRMIFRPQHSKLDTVGFNADTTGIMVDTLSTGHHSWGGITRFFAGLDATRAQLFEIRMRTFGSQGKLHFDFGRISEDINGDGLLFTEDGDNNGAVTEQEDTGVDKVFDSEESEFYHPVANPDPHGDNWYFDPGNGKCPLPPDQCANYPWNDEDKRYEWLNGTEGNWQDISVLGNPDKEKLGGSSNLFDEYYSYTLDMTSDSFLVEGSEKPFGNSVWKTYRIPIRDSLAIEQIYGTEDGGSDPDWGATTHVRVWFEADPGQTTWDTVEVADWYFVQSHWQDYVALNPLANFIPDEERTALVVASANEEDGTFSAPPGVEPYTDNTTNVTEAQRGLAMEYSNLNRYDTCIAFKELLQIEQYSGYRSLEMYVHSDSALEVDDNGRSDLRFFFRIGKDSTNFYEYRTYLYRNGPGVDAGWDERNHVTFDFNELTGFKDSLVQDLQQQGGGDLDAVRDPYRIKGSPNLNEIRYFAAGIVNTRATDTAGGPSGIVWLDELRLTDVRKDVGTAGRFSASGNIADLFNYSFGYQSQDPYFRKVSEATKGGGVNNLGSGQNATTYNYNLSASVDRFLPRSWVATIPISYAYSKSVMTPLLRSGSDILLPEETRIEEQSVSESRSISISESFRYRGSNPLFTAFLNRQSVRVTYRRSKSHSVNQPYNFTEGLDVQSKLDLGVAKPPTLPIMFWTKPIPILSRLSGTALGLYPSQWTFNVTYGRNTNISDDRSHNRRSSLKRDLNGSMDINYSLLQNVRLSYTHASHWDLSDLRKVNISFRDLRLGDETRFSQTFSTGYDPALLKWLTTALTYRSNYSDDWDRTTDSRRSSMIQSWGVSGKFDHNRLFGAQKAGLRGRGERGRSNVRGGGAQESVSRPIYDYPLAVMRFLTGWIDAPSYSYARDFKANLPGMAERPAAAYRFGFTRDAAVDTVSQTQSPSSSEGEKYSASSGFTILGGFRTDVKFSQTVGRDLVRSGNRMEQISTNWPGLSIRIAKFSKLPAVKIPVVYQLTWVANQVLDKVVNQVIERFGPKTSYNRTTRESVDLENGWSTLKSTSISRSPLLELNFKISSKLTLTASYNLNEDESEKFIQSTGEHDKITRSSQKGMSFSTQYSFSAPSGIGIPILGRIKFQSQVSLQLQVRLNSDLTEVSTRGGAWVVQTKKSDTQISAQMKYSFSSKINGGLSTRWQDQNNAYQGRKSHTREVQIWVEIKF